MRESGSPAWRDVLAQLDSAQEEYALLAPGNAHYPSAAMRMTAFVSDDEWLLAVQLLAYGRREAQYILLLQLFGSDVPEPGELTSSEPIASTDGRPLFVEGQLQLDIHNFRLLIDGQRRSFSFTAADYVDAGIDVNKTARELALVRLLAAREDVDLMLRPEQVLQRAGNTGLRQLFSLDDWRHPDPGEDELPSDLPCYRAIADCIADRTSEYIGACEDGNTHWSNWVEFE
jgi:hypothetical protein